MALDLSNPVLSPSRMRVEFLPPAINLKNVRNNLPEGFGRIGKCLGSQPRNALHIPEQVADRGDRFYRSGRGGLESLEGLLPSAALRAKNISLSLAAALLGAPSKNVSRRPPCWMRTEKSSEAIPLPSRVNSEEKPLTPMTSSFSPASRKSGCEYTIRATSLSRKQLAHPVNTQSSPIFKEKTAWFR